MVAELSVGTSVDLIGSRFELVARIGRALSDIVLFRTRMAPGKLVPLHSHIDPECFYVLSGKLEIFLLNDTPQWHVVEAGKSLLAADGIKHASRNSTDHPVDMVLATNNRFARFLSEAGRPATADEPFASASAEDIGRILRVSEDYGYWNASPAESAALIDAALSSEHL